MSHLLEKVCKLEQEIHELTELKKSGQCEPRMQELNEAIRLKRNAIKEIVPKLNTNQAQLYALSKIDCTCGAHILFEAINKIQH